MRQELVSHNVMIYPIKKEHSKKIMKNNKLHYIHGLSSSSNSSTAKKLS